MTGPLKRLPMCRADDRETREDDGRPDGLGGWAGVLLFVAVEAFVFAGFVAWCVWGVTGGK